LHFHPTEVGVLRGDGTAVIHIRYEKLSLRSPAAID